MLGMPYLSIIGVAILRVDTLVVNDVLESLIHETALTAHVSFSPRAVDKVLFAEADQFGCLLEGLSFKGSSGTEGPARSALALSWSTMTEGEESSVRPF